MIVAALDRTPHAFAHFRVARPTDQLHAVAEQYKRGLGFARLAEFADHAGFDGVVLGHVQLGYQIEFTQQRGHSVGRAPTQDNLLVFYFTDADAWQGRCAQMEIAGFRRVKSYNPYWDVQGATFEDLDGYRVVLQQGGWPGAES